MQLSYWKYDEVKLGVRCIISRVYVCLSKCERVITLRCYAYIAIGHTDVDDLLPHQA